MSDDRPYRLDEAVFEAVASMVARGEYLDEFARPGGVDRLPELIPTAPDAIAEAEAVIGMPLPPLLRRLYVEVGNGGFGPGYGILGVRGGHTDSGRTAVDRFREARERQTHWSSFVSRGLLPICHWGCAIYAFVDCSTPAGGLWGWDPNPGPGDETALFPGEPSFAAWLEKWIHGRLFQPTLVRDEATGLWRGATDAEIEAMMADT